MRANKMTAFFLAAVLILSASTVFASDAAPVSEPASEGNPVSDLASEGGPVSALPAEDAPVPETAETEIETEEPSHFSVGLVDDMVIATPYYKITLPAEWMGAYTIKTVDNFTGMWLKIFFFHYDVSVDTGHLFSVLLTADKDYEKFPDYELMGELENEAGDVVYHVVAVFPTDVQYARENREIYSAMFDRADEILGSFTAAQGWTYTISEE